MWDGLGMVHWRDRNYQSLGTENLEGLRKGLWAALAHQCLLSWFEEKVEAFIAEDTAPTSPSVLNSALLEA